MNLKFVTFRPLQEGGVTVTLKATEDDIPELATFMRKDVCLSLIQIEIMENRSHILMGIRDACSQIAEQIERELSQPYVQVDDWKLKEIPHNAVTNEASKETEETM